MHAVLEPDSQQSSSSTFIYLFFPYDFILCLQVPVCACVCAWRPETTPWCRPSGPWFFRQGFSQFWGSLIRWCKVAPEPQGSSCLLFPSIGITSAHLKQAAVLQAGWPHSVWEDPAVIFGAAHPSNFPGRKRLSVSHTFSREYIS